ncbi:hypothetical protein BH10PSE13_BH10PSE13_26310 [soil metagenome]
MTDSRAAARAIDALRRGWPIRLAASDGADLTILPVEGVGVDDLTAFDPAGTAPLLLSGARAATMKRVHQRDADNPERTAIIR